MTVTDDYLPVSVQRGWTDLFADIAPDGATEPQHSAAAMVVTNPDTIEHIRLHDDDVKVEAVLRRKDWASAEEEHGQPVRVPLSRVWTYLTDFDLLEIGATTHPRRPILMDAVSFEIAEGSVYACVCSDWRGLGDMATSRYVLKTGTRAGQTLGSVLVQGAARSGKDEVNERRRIALALLKDEYGNLPGQKTLTGDQIGLQVMTTAIVQHFTSGAEGCSPPVHFWIVIGDGVILASSPVPERERSPSGVLADKIDRTLSTEAFGATRPEYQKATQWRIHYDEQFQDEDDDDEDGTRPPGVVGPRDVQRNNQFGVPADHLGIRLADDDLWPSELHSLHSSRYDWPQLLAHALGLRSKLSLTEREAKCLFMLEQGYRQNEIAQRTGWSESTVSRDLQRAARQILLYRTDNL